ncbi:MAG: M20/M25/M40 family metallo-hydrolase [Actinomycetota bacterium]|nr:M20/M25/M40 family metallo-hydrolase [Actinomycetota bacterium]
MVDESRLVRLFETLVRIYSPSRKEQVIADYIKGYIEALGFLAYEDEAGTGDVLSSGNVIVTIPGTAEGPCILFVSHLDTVEPAKDVEPVIENGVIRSKGDTVLGADDKAGVAVMLELASILASKSVLHGPVHLIFTVAEEVGLEGAKALDLSDKKIDYTYVLDASGKVGTIVISAPYQDSFEIEFKGRAAHAGMAPEMGISAIVAASKAIGCMKLGRIDDETTANVGVIEGGKAGNIVPDKARVVAEARSLDVNKLEAQAQHMMECCKAAAKEIGAKVDIKRYRPYDGYLHTGDDPVVKNVMDKMLAVGITPRLEKSGGGSDTNVFNSKGISAVNLGVGYDHVHTTDEYMPISEMVKLANLLVELVKVK